MPPTDSPARRSNHYDDRMGIHNMPARPHTFQLVASAIACATVALIPACNKTKDVTNDSAYGNFSAVATTWKLKSELWLIDMDNNLYLLIPGPAYVGAHNKSSTRDVALLPAGTQVRIDRLTFKSTFETDYLWATGTVVSGEYAGRTVRLDDRLFAPNIFMHQGAATTRPSSNAGSQWEVSPDVLEK